jgi:hypothetical protein
MGSGDGAGGGLGRCGDSLWCESDLNGGFRKGVGGAVMVISPGLEIECANVGVPRPSILFFWEPFSLLSRSFLVAALLIFLYG